MCISRHVRAAWPTWHSGTPSTPNWPSTGLEALAALCELYAGGNPLATLRALRPLHPLQRLAALNLAACPLAALPDCRPHCLFHLSALQVLKPIQRVTC